MLTTIDGKISKKLFEKDGFFLYLISANQGFVKASSNKRIIGTVKMKFYGRWEKYKEDSQFVIKMAFPIYEASNTGEFLSSIPGIGKKTARTLIQTFGDKTIEVCVNFPEKLSGVISESKARKINRYLHDYFLAADVREALFKAEVFNENCFEIAKRFKNAVEIITKDPFTLYVENMLSFQKCEKLREAYNLSEETPSRIVAGILESVKVYMRETGSTVMPRDSIMEKSLELLTGSYHVGGLRRNSYLNKISFLLNRMLSTGNRLRELNNEKIQGIQLSKYFLIELSIKNNLNRLLSKPPRTGGAFRPGTLESPSKGQIEAVKKAISFSVSLISGIAGCGKTSTIKLLLDSLDGTKLLLAPTGKAARRINEETGAEAKTIHSALMIDEKTSESFSGVIEADTIIIDETSMLDEKIFLMLLSAIKTGTRLVLIGDEGQLPSINPGAVFRDLLSGHILPTTTLTALFRQEKTSNISENADKIRKGRSDIINGADFIIQDKMQSDNLLLQEIVNTYIREKKLNPDIMLICPRRNPGKVKSLICSDILNEKIKQRLNPIRDGEVMVKGRNGEYSAGDEVINLKNTHYKNYNGSGQKSICNGDTGVIKELIYDPKFDENYSVIDFSGKTVILDMTDFLLNISHAYAVTVHKAQGSEAKTVIFATSKNDSFMLSQNLIYTAITRSKEKLIMFSSLSVLKDGIRKNITGTRKTGLFQ